MVRAESDAAIDRLRFILAIDDDHSEFLSPLRGRRAARRDDPAGSRTSSAARSDCRRRPAARAVRSADPVQPRARPGARNHPTRRARRANGRLSTPPTSRASGRASPADLRRLGLQRAARRHVRSVSAARSTSSACATRRSGAAADRLLRERGLGPWSVGVIALQGLGSYERGLVGDLGLLKLCKALYGRWVSLRDGRPAEPYESKARPAERLPAEWILPAASIPTSRRAAALIRCCRHRAAVFRGLTRCGNHRRIGLPPKAKAQLEAANGRPADRSGAIGPPGAHEFRFIGKPHRFTLRRGKRAAGR